MLINCIKNIIKKILPLSVQVFICKTIQQARSRLDDVILKAKIHLLPVQFACHALFIPSAMRLKRNAAHKRIAIIAYENVHAMVVNNIISICNYNVNYVEVYALDKMVSELKCYLREDADKITWFSIPAIKGINRHNETRLYASISKAISRKRYLSTVILPSPEYYYYNYRALLSSPPRNSEVIAMIHNVNRIFRNADVDSDLCRVIGAASSFAVPDGLLYDEIMNHRLTQKKVYVFPAIFQEDSTVAHGVEHERFVFVLTGNVDGKRKDFELITRVFARLKDHYHQVELVLLGSAKTPYGQTVIKQCEALRQEGLAVAYYTDFVPIEEFRVQMQRCDYLLGPCITNYSDHGLVEIYNKTKITALILDMIEYARPAIVPNDLAMPADLMSSTLFYKDENSLCELIVSLLDHDRCSELNHNALENSRKYCAEKYYL